MTADDGRAQEPIRRCTDRSNDGPGRANPRVAEAEAFRQQWINNQPALSYTPGPESGAQSQSVGRMEWDALRRHLCTASNAVPSKRLGRTVRTAARHCRLRDPRTPIASTVGVP